MASSDVRMLSGFGKNVKHFSVLADGQRLFAPAEPNNLMDHLVQSLKMFPMYNLNADDQQQREGKVPTQRVMNCVQGRMFQHRTTYSPS